MFDDKQLPEILPQFIELRKIGTDEYDAPCPFCKGLSVHFKLWRASGEWVWECSKQSLGGNREDFIANVHSELAGEIPAKKKRHKEFDPYAEHVQLTPPESEVITEGVEFTAWNPKNYDDPKKQFVTYKPDMVFPYRTREGVLIGYVIRKNTSRGKITPLICWVKRPDGQEGWCHWRFDEPTPLYGAERLTPGQQVLVVEGEKAADAGYRLLGLPTVSWYGGTSKVSATDWSQLAGFKIVIMPDADEPGIEAASKIAAILVDICPEVKLLQKDSSKPKGWDIADAEEGGLTAAQVLAWMKQRAVVFEPSTAPPVEAYHEHTDEPPPEGYEPQDTASTDDPFQILGYNDGIYYYLPHGSQQIKALSSSQHTAPNLISMATLDYWETNFQAKHGFDLSAAQNSMMHRSHRLGVFNPHNRIRGRGAWIDKGEVVVHTGDRILVNGHEHQPAEFESDYIYQRAESLDIYKTQPAGNKEAHQLVDIMERLTWEHKLSGPLLAGWCIIAPVCGMLQWRPHIWLTGELGSGKSTVLDCIIEPMLGKIGVRYEGASEAGIRQNMGCDARPVMYDEAESEGKKDANNMQAILSLARKGSSGGQIVKGSSGGSPVIYRALSAFCFSSINTALKQGADISRVSRLKLKKDRRIKADEIYKELMRDIISTINDEYSARMFSRTMDNIETLRKNCKTFIDAAAVHFGSRRPADQVGPMLAGYYLCFKTDEITFERAEEFILENEWHEHTNIGDTSDGENCLAAIVSHRLRVHDKTEKRDYDVTIGELIVIANKNQTAFAIDAHEALQRIGITTRHNSGCEEGFFVVSNKSKPLCDILANEPWATDPSRRDQLKTIKGCAGITATINFGPAIRKHRGVALPVEILEG